MVERMRRCSVLLFLLFLIGSQEVDGHKAKSLLKTELKNDFLANGALAFTEKPFFALFAMYMLSSVLLDVQSNAHIEKWKPVALIFPTYDLWRNSMEDDNPRRFSICRDFPISNKRIPSSLQRNPSEEVLRMCYDEMLKLYDSDPLNTSDRYMPSLRTSVSLMSGLLRSLAAIFAILMSLGIVSARIGMTSTGPQNVKSISSHLQGGDSSYVSVNLDISPDQAVISTTKLLNSLMHSVAPIRNAVAGFVGTVASNVDVLPLFSSAVQYPDSVDSAAVHVVVAFKITEFHSATGALLTTEEALGYTTGLLQSNTTSADLAARLCTSLKADTSFSSVNCQSSTPPLTVALAFSPLAFMPGEVLNERAGRFGDSCGALRSEPSLGHGAAYDHVSRDQPCLAGENLGAICQVHCETNFMTSERFGRVAVCGFDDSSDQQLKWLPAGEAYQGMCAPDPVFRTSGLALRLTSDTPIASSIWTNWANPAGAPQAKCEVDSDACFTIPTNGATADSSVSSIQWKSQLPYMDRRVFYWNGNARPLRVAGLSNYMAALNQSPSNHLLKGVTMVTAVTTDVSHPVGEITNAQNILDLKKFVAEVFGATLEDFLSSSYSAAHSFVVITTRARCGSCTTAGATTTCSLHDATLRINGVPVLQDTAPVKGETGATCAACCQQLGQSIGFDPSTTALVGNGGHEGSSERYFIGSLAELAFYAKSLANWEIEQIEYFLGAKWGSRPYIAPAKPPAPITGACRTVVADQVYSVDIEFPVQGGQLYTANTFRVRACACQGTVSGGLECAKTGVCEDVQFGMGSKTFSGLQSDNGEFKFVLQTQSGELLLGEMWEHLKRPNWQNCGTGSDEVNCWVTGDISTQKTTCKTSLM